VDNIKIDLGEIGWDGMDWFGSGQRPVEGSCEHSNEFHIMLGSSSVAAQLVASQEGLSSMSEWVIQRICQCRLMQQIMSYLTTLKLQLVSWSVVGLTATKFKPLVLPTWLVQYHVHLNFCGLEYLLPVSCII
jgi:hypothetical protein